MTFAKFQKVKSPCAGGLSPGKSHIHAVVGIILPQKVKKFLINESLEISVLFSVSFCTKLLYTNLKLKQKAAVRIVLCANCNDHTEPVFKHLNILLLVLYANSLTYSLYSISYRIFARLI